MPFYKFRLSRLGRNAFPVGSLDRHYVFPRSSGSYDPATDTAVLFLTPDGGPNPRTAQNELSITYSPGSRCTVDVSALIDSGFTVKDNLGRVVPDVEDRLHEIPRIWPAFGYPGGRRELLLIPPGNDPKTQVPVISELDTGGGAPTLWHLDDSLLFSPLPAALSLGLATGLSAAARDRLQNEDVAPPEGGDGFPGVARDGAACIIVLLKGVGHRSRLATLSSAYVLSGEAARGKAPDSSGIVEARFWVAMWEDLGHERWLLNRTIEPLTQACVCCLGQFDPVDLARIAGRVLLSRALAVSDEHFRHAAVPVTLP